LVEPIDRNRSQVWFNGLKGLSSLEWILEQWQKQNDTGGLRTCHMVDELMCFERKFLLMSNERFDCARLFSWLFFNYGLAAEQKGILQ
jgi:hypothetical protein